VLVPRDFARELKRGGRGEVTAWFNAQFLLSGNVVSRELQTAVVSFSAQVEGLARMKRGASPEAVSIEVMPVAARRDSLHNPWLNYVPFLVAGLAAGLLHMMAMLAVVRSTGRELRDRTAGEWLAVAGGRIVPAVLAKLALPAVAYTVLGTAYLAGVHGWLGWPMRGNWSLLLGSLVALVLACEGLGLLVVGITANYRLAGSVAAFLTAPALAFAGLTFPLGSMPVLAQGWGHALPLTAFLRLQIEQAVRGAPVAESWPELSILGGVAIVAIVLAMPLLAWRARKPECWGRT
jgi:ABC-2 type transport system permease protein